MTMSIEKLKNDKGAKRRNKNAVMGFDNLYLLDGKYRFRKYSSEKRKDFYYTCTESKPRQAFKEGEKMFHEWLGHKSDMELGTTVKDIALLVLDSKESKRPQTYRSARNQIGNHIIPAFGYLRPDQITSLLWKSYDAKERRKGRTKLFNTRKFLMEIMKHALDAGLIKKMPKLENNDPPARDRLYVKEATFRKLLKACDRRNSRTDEPFKDRKKLAMLLNWIYYMGARPGEILQYEWSMIRWDQGLHGSIHIPGSITKTGQSREIPLNSTLSKILKQYQTEFDGKYIFPSKVDPNQHMSEYKKGWRTICEEAGVSGVQIYDLRSTWVTNAARRGVNIVFAANYIGTSVEMIQRIYAVAETEVMEEVAG